MNPQPLLETHPHARCPQHDFPLRADGKCLFGNHWPKEEAKVVAIVAPKPQPKLERLDGLLWEAYEVPAVKVSLSGSIEATLDALDELGLAGLEPGERLAMSVQVTVAQMATGRDAKDAPSGTLKLRVDSIRAAERLE